MFTASTDTIRLTVEVDADPASPREWDNLGVMVCWHRSYILGDVQPKEDPVSWLAGFREENPRAVILPLYLYDHSGITMNTVGFSCPWDSGQVGYIVCMPESQNSMGTPDDLVKAALQSEVEVYSQFLEGECYGFIVERLQPCGRWDHDYSCWGFLGTDWKDNGMAEHLADDVIPLLDELLPPTNHRHDGEGIGPLPFFACVRIDPGAIGSRYQFQPIPLPVPPNRGIPPPILIPAESPRIHLQVAARPRL